MCAETAVCEPQTAMDMKIFSPSLSNRCVLCFHPDSNLLYEKNLVIVKLTLIRQCGMLTSANIRLLNIIFKYEEGQLDLTSQIPRNNSSKDCRNELIKWDGPDIKDERYGAS